MGLDEKVMKAPGERGWRGGREMEENGKGEGKGN